MLLFAFAALLSNALIEVQPSHWRAVDLPVKQHDTFVEGDFEVVRGSRVQIIIADRAQAERLNRGRSFRPLYSSGFSRDGRFRFAVRESGEYVIVVDNRIEGRTAAQVRLNVNLSNRTDVDVRELPPERRRAVVALSLLFFGATVALSAWLFLRQAS